MDLEDKLLIDELRRELRDCVYNPLTGEGCCGDRVLVPTPVDGLPQALVPMSMKSDPAYAAVLSNSIAWERLRCRDDFEYWAWRCARVKDKQSSNDIAFRLNSPQRRVVSVLEADRLSGKPMRLILLKARQWGGSTLIQMYMAWIQTVHRTNWNSVIVAHVKDVSASIRGMYTKMLSSYPKELWEGDEEPEFKPYERSNSVRRIAGRDCLVTIGTGEKPDSVRGLDYAMAHLSETAYWPATPTHTPHDVVRAVAGSIAMMPDTLIAIESTARGVGDYFHSEWLRCKSGEGDKHAVFVPWQEIEFYRYAPADPAAILDNLDSTHEALWRRGCASDQLYWHRLKTREFPSAEMLNSEFPGNDTEAFSNSKGMVFSSSTVGRLRQTCMAAKRRGDTDSSGSRFIDDENGLMQLWDEPAPGGSYVVAVDVGGRSAGADWSVIAVLRADGLKPEVVAQWRGHIDHDLLAAKSAQIATYYNKALLVIESNTYETGEYGGADSNLFILNRLAESYGNMYLRESYDSVQQCKSHRVGFHTNRSTKAILISGLIEAVRECLYIERDGEACNELLVYEQAPNGSYAARPGHHDDVLMTRAIALHVIRSGQAGSALTDFFKKSRMWE